uniref:Neurotransmitter-gated ion-channel ligand-binding domain-containing protein n=1 Tax=Plectus sambesii TaxID=2011161 RepID=A0A914VRR4_9BILA
MDEKQKTITFHTSVDMIWKDEHIGWNASEFGGISSILIPSNLLWKPDIFVTNGLDVKYMLSDEQRFVSVQNNGTVRSLTLCVITNECHLSIDNFPYDIQTCHITLASWMYPTDQIDLIIGKRRQNVNAAINDGDFTGNEEWTLVSFDKELHSYIGSDGQQYAMVEYTVKLRRQPIYYICVLLIPTFITTTICLFGLFVPTMNTGERVEKAIIAFGLDGAVMLDVTSNANAAILKDEAAVREQVVQEAPVIKGSTNEFFCIILMVLNREYRHFPLLWYILAVLAASNVFANQFDVYKAITSDYDKNVLRVRNSSEPVVVSIELIFFQLLNMDQHQETITFITTLDMIWKDENLRWNASEFGGTSSVVIPSSLLWKPDILLTSGLSIDNITPEEQRYVIVLSDGTVQSSSFCLITNQCRLSIADFPYDVQTCHMTFVSWMYSTDQIDLVVGKKRRNLNDTINDGYSLGNGEWTLVSFDKELHSYDGSDGHLYARVIFTVKLRRQPIYYICVLLIPIFVTATICLLGLFVPAMNTGERVEKMNMGLATLLSMAIILGIVAGEMPKSKTLPLLGIINTFLAYVNLQF